MILRNILSELHRWKASSNRKPLIIRGARQTGKTTLVNEFGKEYDNYLYFNLDELENKELLKNAKRFEDVLTLLFLAKGVKRDAKPTLIFLDEIQEIPELIPMLRYFYEKANDIHVIAAGSLLEHVLGDVDNFPVGRVNYLVLNPINFEEYLHALKLDRLIEKLNEIPIDPLAESLLFDAFHHCAMLGGMPEIVDAYSKRQDINDCIPLYEGIVYSYQNDILKYAKNLRQVNILIHILQNVASEADNRISFEGFANSSYRSQDVKDAMMALEKAKIIQLIHPTHDIIPPAVPDKKVKPRLQYLDTGLMNFALGIQSEFLKVDDLNDLYRGKIIQHLITQEYISTHTSPLFKPLFWVREKKTSNAEVDLICPYEKYLIPVEIKSGATGKLKSLMMFMDQCNHCFAVRLYKGPLLLQNVITPAGKPFTLLNLPYFLACKLDQYIQYYFNRVSHNSPLNR